MEVSEITLEKQREEKFILQCLIEDAIKEFGEKTGLLVEEISISNSEFQCGYIQTVNVKAIII